MHFSHIKEYYWRLAFEGYRKTYRQFWKYDFLSSPP